MIAEGQHAGLRREIGPSLFEAVTRLAQTAASCIHLQHLQAPAETRCQAQGSVMIEPAVIKIVRRHARHDALQTFRLFGSGQQLRHALIREAVHADAAIRFGSRAKPGNALRSIAALGSKGVKLASGISPAAHILNHDVVSMPGEPNGMCIDNC